MAQGSAGTLGVWVAPEGLPSVQAVALAQRVEALGYSTMWLAETFGRDPFALAASLGAATSSLVLATGIANVYHRHAGVMKQGANTIAEQTGGRFILGLGVSSPQIVERQRGLDPSKPLTFLRKYLDDYDAALYLSVPPPAPVPVVLAALGPRMLELAGERSAGALTYNVTPEHTAMARERVGSGATLHVEQKVILTTDPAKARATAAGMLRFYRKAPGYRNAWHAMGFTDDDIDGPSERWLDAIVAWGDEDAIRARLQAHRDAGADDICIQVLHPDLGIGGVDDDALRILADG
jgi:probable F420-dependent oxidoreductase